MTINFTQKTTKEVIDLFTLINNEKGRTMKEVLLKGITSPEFWWVVEKALNPAYNYFGAGEKIEEAMADPSFEDLKSQCKDNPMLELDSVMQKIYINEVDIRKDAGIEELKKIVARWSSEGLDDYVQCLLKILKKDLGCGVGAKTINKALGKTFIRVVPYMRCSLPKQVPFETLPWKEGVISQEKCDGMFANINVTKSGFEIYSRAGTRFDLELLYGDDLHSVAKTLHDAMLENYQYHGEMLVIDRKTKEILPREEGNGLLNSVLQGSPIPEGFYVRLVIWDAVPLENALEAKAYELGYAYRFANLLNRYKWGLTQGASPNVLQIVETVVVSTFEDAQEHYRKMLREGKEGTVIKTRKGIWKDGTSKDQIKMKLTVECDLKVVGLEAGKGKNKDTFGSLQCQTSDGKLEVSVSGFTDALRAEIFANQDKYIGQVVTVKFNGVMTPKEEGEKYSLFLPRFSEFRFDKDTPDSLERVIEQQESAIKNV